MTWGPFGGAIDGLDDHAQTIAEIVSFQARLLALGHAGFGAAQIDDYIGAFKALDDAIDQLADAPVIFVEDGVALGLAHLLHDDLLGGLRGDAAQDGSRLGNEQFAADGHVGIDLAGFGKGHFFLGIGDLVDHGANRIHVDLTGFGIELGAQIFVGLVILPRGDHHGVFNSRHDDLGLDMLFPADLLNHLVQQIGHSYAPTTRRRGSLCESHPEAIR